MHCLTWDRKLPWRRCVKKWRLQADPAIERKYNLLQQGNRMKKDDAGPADYLIFLGQVAALLDSDFLREAETFDYGQWELPFEAVLLKLMEESPKNEGIDIGLAKKLAKYAGLLDEGVLTPDTWQRFIYWYGAPAR